MAALDLIWLGIPILWGAAFDDIRDVNLLPSKINGLEDLSQELSSLSDKRPSLNIFVITRAFPDEHQFRLLISLSKNECMPGSMEFTSPTIP